MPWSWRVPTPSPCSPRWDGFITRCNSNPCCPWRIRSPTGRPWRWCGPIWPRRGFLCGWHASPPWSRRGLGDALAQGLPAVLECLPLAELLASSTLVIAPGHLGTGHLEAIARGRAVVVVSPGRLNRPSQLLASGDDPLPRLVAADVLGWWQRQDAAALERLAADQAEWLRQELVTSQSLIGWLRGLGVDHDSRPQRFLGSGLMAQQPLIERVEAMDRLSRRVAALRRTVPGRVVDRLRRWGRAR